MTTRDRQLILRAIENCENREKRFCQEYSALNPADRDKRERILNNFLFATMMVRFEIDRMIEADELRSKGA